ncbi:MAG: acetylglutamate kinase [Bacteroidetes bacterium]|nr:MAG: acetylglutamate kinase [Bacteroidota bacterium]
METLVVIKIGGNIIDDESKLSSFLQEFASIPGRKILVHGGGKLATRLAEQLGVEQQMIDGRRITDEHTLRIVTMVYAGFVNKNIVASLQSFGCNAIGLSGADGNVILAHKRNHPSIDFGFAGDIDQINVPLIKNWLDGGLTLVIAPITHDKKGQLLNTNADTIAQEIARAMSSEFEVNLIYSFEKKGVLLDATDESTVIADIRPSYYEQLKAEKKIFAGMIPKIDNAFVALKSGVRQVTIGKAEDLRELINHRTGTRITND